MFEKLKALSEKRIKYFIKNPNSFYNWYDTYFKNIHLELEEVEKELKKDNSVYLEDELWDVLWDYLCLLNSLKEKWYITSIDKIIERSYNKFVWRIWENADCKWLKSWDEIKKIQKEELKDEHKNLHW